MSRVGAGGQVFGRRRQIFQYVFQRWMMVLNEKVVVRTFDGTDAADGETEQLARLRRQHLAHESQYHTHKETLVRLRSHGLKSPHLMTIPKKCLFGAKESPM
jgi:hypothetical protein